MRHIVAEIEKYSCPVEESVKQSLDYLLDAPFVKACLLYTSLNHKDNMLLLVQCHTVIKSQGNEGYI